MFYIQIIISK